jgi:hypothetical protein
MQNLSLVLGALGLLFSGISAVFAIVAQRKKIRENMDQFINDLNRQGRLTMWSSIFQFATFTTLFLRLLFVGTV